MQIDLEALRQHYDRLTDEALLEVDPDDLLDMARVIYEAEVSRRGIALPAEQEPEESVDHEPMEVGELEPLSDFDNVSEAQMTNSLLRSAGFASQLDAPRSSLDVRPIRIWVPRHELEAALELLAVPLSEEDLAAQSEAAGQAALVPVAVFMMNPSAAQLARAALEAADIPCYLENEHTLNADRLLSGVVGGERLMVPPDYRFRARQVLEAVISDEDLAAEAEAAGNGE